MEPNMLTSLKIAEIVVEYECSAPRLILLDYDGTLVEIQSHPSHVIPSGELLEVIKSLSSDKKNTVAIITGRDKEYISQWFSDMNVYIFAEHGSFIKQPGQDIWTTLYNGNQNWKSIILSILESYTDKTKGAIIEEKTSSIAWHYRNVDSKQVFDVVEELFNSLKKNITTNMNINILEGKKVIEIKQKGYDKGSASLQMIKQKKYQFILSIGDDITDEDMFKVLPIYAHSLKVGYGSTRAKMNIENPKEVMDFLKKLLQN